MDRPRRTHRRTPPLLAALCCLLLLAATQLGPQPPDAAAARAPSWTWPLAPRPAVVHPFAPPAKPWLSGHRGVDLAAPQGSTVLAPADGVVVFSGWVVDRGVVTLRHANGLLGSFEPVDSPLEPGDEVTAGQPLGTLAGRTHCGPGPPGPGSCLHWGVRRGEEYINPLQFVLDLRPSVLLPLMDTNWGAVAAPQPLPNLASSAWAPRGLRGQRIAETPVIARPVTRVLIS